MIRNQHKPGDWLYCCQQCDDEVYASETRRQWDGLRVCRSCWEPRHPQDRIRAKKDKISVPFANPPTYTYIDPNDVTPDSY